MEKNGPVSPVFSQTAALTLPDLKKARGPRARGTDRRGQIPHMPPMAARITRLVLLARMDGTDAWSARAGFTKTLRHVPALLRKTLTYGLLCRYLPKGTDLSGYTQRELNAITHRLNTRPRKCLDVATPLEVYAQLGPHAPVALGT
jgi:transposase, IS30 family